MKSFLPRSKKSDLVIQELAEETLIYDLSKNKAHCLNKTAAMVWQLCDGTRTVADISNEMSKSLKELVNEDFVYFALNQMERDGLLETETASTSHFAGLSRREVIRKIGFGTMVVLPIVSSIVAPAAVFAQSCLAPGSVVGNSFACAPPGPCSCATLTNGNTPAACCSGTSMAHLPCPGGAVLQCVCVCD